MALKEYLTNQKKTTVFIPNITCIALPQVALQSGHDVTYFNWLETPKAKPGDIVIVQAVLGVLPSLNLLEDFIKSGNKVVLDISQAYYIPDEYMGFIKEIDFVFSSFQVNKPHASSSNWGGVGFFKEQISGVKRISIYKELILNLKGVLIDVLPEKYLKEFNRYFLKQDHSINNIDIYFTQRNFLSEAESSNVTIQSDIDSDLKGINCGFYFPLLVKNKNDFILKYGEKVKIYNWPQTVLSPYRGNLDEVNFPNELIEKTQWYADHLLGIVIKNEEDHEWLIANIGEIRSKWSIRNF
ncbi:MAG: hypothetical protein GY909_06510 [Oligoflexia bacterium]|nr:hypothetical protein [Oligoflexia bacterium]